MEHGQHLPNRETQLTATERLGLIQDFLNTSAALLVQQAFYLRSRYPFLAPADIAEANKQFEKDAAEPVEAAGEALKQLSRDTKDNLHILNPDDSTKWGKVNGLSYSVEQASFVAYVRVDQSTSDEWKIIDASQLFIGNTPPRSGSSNAFSGATTRQINLRMLPNSVVLNYGSDWRT